MHVTASLTRCAAWFAVLLLALLCAGRASAQGTQGALPDPITTPELMRYADRLGLSDEQRRAAERLHDEYREEFGALREGDIAAFMENMRGMQGTMPQRRTFEDFIRRWERLYDRIAQLDDRLFHRLTEIVTEQQQAMLPRVRLARERQRLSGGMQQMMMMGSPLVDLTTIIDVLEMHPAERMAIDPALASYEQRLTTAMRDVHRATNRMYVDMFTAFEEAGVTEEMLTDPAQMGAIMEKMQQVMMDLMSAIMARGRELNELNEGALRTMRPALSPESARALRNMFYSQAYPAVNFALRLPVEAKLETAISLEQISEPLRESLTDMLNQTRFRADRILDEAIALQKDQQANFSPFSMESFDWEEYGKRLGDLQANIHAIERESNERMLAMLAEEVDETARQKVAEATHEQPPIRGSRSQFTATIVNPDTEVEEPTTRSPHDQHLPGPISRHDVALYAQILELDEARAAVLDELHAAYLERHAAQTGPQFEALSQALGRMWQKDSDVDVVEDVYRLRGETLAEVLAADASFFEEVELTLCQDDEALNRLDRARAARLREVYSIRSPHAFDLLGRNANRIARIDLSRLVRLVSLPVEELHRIDRVLLDYEHEMVEALREQYEASIAMSKAQERWSKKLMRAQQDGANQFEVSMRYQEALGDPQRKVSEASRRIVELNEAAITELLALLRSDHAARLDDAYRRRAFPNIYNDLAAVDKQLTAALRLPDVTEQQRSHLTDLLGDYRPVYADLTERMVATIRTARIDAAILTYQPEDWQRHMDLMEKLDRLRFDRNELNARAIGRLRSILNDSQLAALGPLPEPAEERSGMWGF